MIAARATDFGAADFCRTAWQPTKTTRIRDEWRQQSPCPDSERWPDAVTRRPAPSRVFEPIRSEIETSRELLTLPAEWDDDDAKPISKEVWERATDFLIRHAKWAWHTQLAELPAPAILPCPDGSVDLHWNEEQFALLVNFPPESGQAATFYGDDRGGGVIKGNFDPNRLNRGVLVWLIRE